MGKKDNILPSPVNGLEFDFEGPSADYLIDTSHIYNRTIYQDVHAKKEEWTVIDKSEAKDYFPIREQDIQLTIGIQEKKTTVDLPTFGSIKLDDHFEYKRGFVLNTGGSIWGLGFVPKSPPSPQEDTKVQYLAVGGYKGNSEEHIEMNQRQPTGAYKNCIQIWRMILSVEVPYEEPVLDLCLLHDYGVIFDLRWCPYGVYEDNDICKNDNELPKLGILSFACGDGTIRTIIVPHPKAIRKHMCPDTNDKETIYLRINKSRCTFSIATSRALTIAWGGHDKLAAGHTLGNLTIWDMESALQNSEEVNETALRNQHLIFSCIPLDSAIRALSWNGHYYPEKIVMTGFDGRVSLIDINDPFIPLTLFRARSVIANCAWTGHSAMMIYSDTDNITQAIGLNVDGTTAKIRYGEIPGFCWTTATSEHHGQFAVGSSLGWVRSCNMYQRKLRQLYVAQNTVYKLHYHEDKDIYQYIDGIGKQTVDETRKMPNYRQYGETQMQIQRIVWNPNKSTSAFLASGGAAGLCRIEFEGRGSKWE